MSMAGVGTSNPRIALETSTGTVYDLPVYDLEGNASPINLQPIDPFDQINIVGDTAKALDRRVDRVIPSDQRGGAGRDKYVETEGVTDYRESDADPRFPGALVCRAKKTALGVLPTATFGQQVIWVGYAGATIHSWGMGNSLYYHNGAAWVATAGIVGGTMYGYTRGFGYTWALGFQRAYRSADGINFVAVGAGAFTGLPEGLAVFDGKLWTCQLDAVANVMNLQASVNPTAAAGVVAFTTVASIPMNMAAGTSETFAQLFTWKDGAGSPALGVLTTQRLLIYNPVGGTLEEYDDFSANNPEGGAPAPSLIGMCALQFKSTNDLYVGQGQNVDYLMRYSPGAGFAKTTPNLNGGLPRARQGSPRALAQNAYGLGVWTSDTSLFGGGTAHGGAWFLTPEGGWHCLNRDISGTLTIWGGGMGGGKFWTVFSDRSVDQQDLPNNGSRPQFAVGRKYEINTFHYHNYGRTDFGTEGTRLGLLGFDLCTVKSDGTDLYGLDAAASLVVDYKINGGAWTPVSQYKDNTGTVRTLPGNTITAALTNVGFPLRLVINNEFGVVAYEVEWRVGLRTSNEDQTPVVVYCAPRAKKTPPPHYTYDFVINVQDLKGVGGMGQGGVLPVPGGKSPAGIHKGLELLDQLGNMVKLTYGVGGQNRSDICEFAMAPQLHPQAGVGRYRISLRSVASDASG